MCKALSEGSADIALLLSEGAMKYALDTKDIRVASVFVKSPLQWGIHCGFQAPMKELGDLKEAATVFAISRMGSGSHLMVRGLNLLEWK